MAPLELVRWAGSSRREWRASAAVAVTAFFAQTLCVVTLAHLASWLVFAAGCARSAFGHTNAADPLKCPPEGNSSLLLTPTVPPTVLPSMPASFGALQVAWVEDELKLFGCRDTPTQKWRLFMFNITASDWEASDTDILARSAADVATAKAMASRMAAWQGSVQRSQTGAETNCSSKWATGELK